MIRVEPPLEGSPLEHCRRKGCPNRATHVPVLLLRVSQLLRPRRRTASRAVLRIPVCTPCGEALVAGQTGAVDDVSWAAVLEKFRADGQHPPTRAMCRFEIVPLGSPEAVQVMRDKGR